jgi:hypothetical protein
VTPMESRHMQTGSSLYDPTIIEQFADRLYE